MYETLLSLLLCTSASGVLVDRTLEPGASGRDVVDTVLYRIRRSRVFPDDEDFVRRVAYTESMFGEDSRAYRPGYYEGIWQTNRFNYTQNDGPGRSISPRLRSIHEAIKETMGIDWMRVIEPDLLKPLYSGLTAWIIIDLFPRTIAPPLPDYVIGQDRWWSDFYSAKKTVYGNFENRTLDLLIEDMRPFGGKIDLMLVVDGSCRVGLEAFASSLDSLARLVNVFDLREANVGMIVYSDRVTDKIPLMNDLTMLGLQESIRRTDYPNDTANIYVGIKGAINEFNTLPNTRKGVPRLMVIFTDGNHTAGPDPGLAAEKAAKAGIVTCAFGIGDAIDDGQLLRIANNDADFKFKTASHYTLREQIVRVAHKAKTIPQTLKMGSGASVTMRDGDTKRYFLLEVPEEGTTITLINDEGETRGYWTFTPELPSSALYEGVLTEGETFISPPRLGKHRRRRRTNVTMPPKNMLLTLQSQKADNRVTVWIDEGDVTGCGFAASKFDITGFFLSATFAITTVLLK